MNEMPYHSYLVSSFGLPLVCQALTLMARSQVLKLHIMISILRVGIRYNIDELLDSLVDLPRLHTIKSFSADMNGSDPLRAALAAGIHLDQGLRTEFEQRLESIDHKALGQKLPDSTAIVKQKSAGLEILERSLASLFKTIDVWPRPLDFVLSRRTEFYTQGQEKLSQGRVSKARCFFQEGLEYFAWLIKDPCDLRETQELSSHIWASQEFSRLLWSLGISCTRCCLDFREGAAARNTIEDLDRLSMGYLQYHPYNLPEHRLAMTAEINACIGFSFAVDGAINHAAYSLLRALFAQPGKHLNRLHLDSLLDLLS